MIFGVGLGVGVGAGFGVGFGAGVVLFLHGQRCVRAASQSSNLSCTVANESVNLRFSRNRLSTTNSVRSQSKSCSVVFWFLQPANNTIVAVKGSAKWVKKRLFVIL